MKNNEKEKLDTWYYTRIEKLENIKFKRVITCILLYALIISAILIYGKSVYNLESFAMVIVVSIVLSIVDLVIHTTLYNLTINKNLFEEKSINEHYLKEIIRLQNKK